MRQQARKNNTIRMMWFLCVLLVLTAYPVSRGFALEDPNAIFTFGLSSNSNIQSKEPEDSDGVYDLSLLVVVPHKINKQSKANLELIHKQDWKGKSSNQTLNTLVRMYNLRFMQVFSKKLAGQFAFMYQDVGAFVGRGFNLSILPKLTSKTSLKFDYTYAKRSYERSSQDGNNHIFKIEYKMNTTPLTTLTPFYTYESNTSDTSKLEYKGHTLGLKYRWKFNEKMTFLTGYDYRSRDYGSATCFATAGAGLDCKTNAKLGADNGRLATKKENRHQFTLGMDYLLDKNMTLNVKYNLQRNNASSNVADYVAAKSYSTNVFSLSLTIKSLKMKKEAKGE